MDNFNQLTPAETERLSLLIEECSETIQAATKILRHGYSSTNPTIKEAPTNRQDLMKEIGHIGAALELMYESGDVDFEQTNKNRLEKQRELPKWLHHN